MLFRSESLGYHSQIILSGRRVNDGMGVFVADSTIKQIILAGKAPKESKIIIFGLTFKENCPDIRNSKVIDIVRRLEEYGIHPILADPWVKPEEAKKEYAVELLPVERVRDVDCVILAVAHDEFKKFSWEDFEQMYKKDLAGTQRILIEIGRASCRERV